MNHTPTIASPLPCAFCRGQALFVTQSLFVIHPLPLDYRESKCLNWVLSGLGKGRIRDHAKTAAGQPAAVLAWSLLARDTESHGEVTVDRRLIFARC